MNFDFLARKGVPEIKPYVPGKPIEEVKRELGIEGEIVKLASNENPLGASPLAQKAIEKSLDECHLYPDGGGFALRKKIAEKFEVEPDEIILGTGSSEIIELIVKAFADKEDEIIAPDKGFAMYRIATSIVGCKGKFIPEKENNHHDLKKILAAISGKTKAVFLDNPANPLGTLLKRDEIKAFLKEIPRNILVVLDEAYYEYATEPDYADSLKEFFKEMENLLILRTFSKIYGLAGMRIGYCFAHKDIISLINKVRQPFNTPRLSQIAAYAALDDTEHLQKSIEINEKGRKYFYSQFKEMGLNFTESHTNFVLVDVGRDAREVFKEMQKRGVVIRPMSGYGMPKSIRISIGTMPQNEKCVKVLKEVL